MTLSMGYVVVNLMVAPRYVGAMGSIRALSDFELQADKLAGPRPSENPS